jgi:hypothetical protein
MSEENFLRYRLECVRLMPEGAYKTAVLAAIRVSLAALRPRQAALLARAGHLTSGYS